MIENSKSPSPRFRQAGQLSSQVSSSRMNITSQKLAYWFITKAESIDRPLTPAKLIHLSVLACHEYLRDFGIPLMNESTEAWENGPVLPTLYHEYKEQGFCHPIEHTSRRQSPLEHDDQIEAFLESIWNKYDKYTARQLARASTRPGTPWDITIHSSESFRHPAIGESAILAYYSSLRP